MGYPVWISPIQGDLDKVAAQQYYNLELVALDPDDPTNAESCAFELIAGQLPKGLQISPKGQIIGQPVATYTLQGVPFSVNVDVTSEFTIRATSYTDGKITDRTFSITITGNFPPEILTISDPLGIYLDGTHLNLQLEAIDLNNDPLTWTLEDGQLPAGLSLSNTGLISGFIIPQFSDLNPNANGWSEDKWSGDPWEFAIKSNNFIYNFTVGVSDGKIKTLRKYKIEVYAHNDLRTDNIVIMTDNTNITADMDYNRPPILLTQTLGDNAIVNSGGYFAFQFQGIDYDGYPVQYNINTGNNFGWDGDINWDMTAWDIDALILPPGLTLDTNTGWLTGYIPHQAETKINYTFGVYVNSTVGYYVESTPILFTLTILGDLDLSVQWITSSNLGTIVAGGISNLKVEAFAPSGKELTYTLDINSKLPQGLTLLSDGTISGRVSFQAMAYDQGKTTFDKILASQFVYNNNTNFDNNFQFNVTASNFSISKINIAPEVETAGQWQPMTAYLSSQYISYNGSIYSVVRNFTSGTGFDTTNLSLYWGYSVEQVNEISSTQTFTVRVNPVTYEPYENLYIRCLPSADNRQILEQIINNTDIFDPADVYRPHDPYFGISTELKILVNYGIKASDMSAYISAMQTRHFNKKFYFGNYKLAQGKDINGNVLYDVIYVDMIEDTKIYTSVNGVSKKLIPASSTDMNRKNPNWRNPRAINATQNILNVDSSNTVDAGYIKINDTYYLRDPLNQITPNDLTLMQLDITNNLENTNLNSLPEWMISIQSNGRILGYTSGAVLAYLKPGTGARALYRMNRYAPYDIKVVPFVTDRYVLNNSYTTNFDLNTRKFVAKSYTIFDRLSGGSSYITTSATVDFAVNRPFSSINNQSLDYMIETNGLDGVTYNLDQKYIIFATQESFNENQWGLLPNDGWNIIPLETGNYRWDDTIAWDMDVWDKYNPINSTSVPGYLEKINLLSFVNQRAGVWKINVDANNYISLTFVKEINPGNYVFVNSGVTHSNSYQLYDPATLSLGYSVPQYSQSFNAVLKPRAITTFDRTNTVFINNVDKYTIPLQGDKYLKFPKQQIFLNGQ